MLRLRLLVISTALALASCTHRPPAAVAPEYDLVIRHGRVIDGTGAAAFVGDVAVRDGSIAAIGAVRGRGREEIDATGKIVAPGFIDGHTHCEDILQLPQ